MLKHVRGEALAINSILHLHCLLVDPSADPTMVMPIDILFKMVVAMVATEVHQCVVTHVHVRLHGGYGPWATDGSTTSLLGRHLL